MSKQVPWNKIILEEFIELACLSNTEEMIIRTRVKGWSITEQSHKLHMSESSIKRIIARLKVKYDNVQEYSPILPKRKSSVAETWMDEHWGVLGLLFFLLHFLLSKKCTFPTLNIALLDTFITFN